MPKRIVIDTSVVLKWVPSSGENGVDEAREIYRKMKLGQLELLAPVYLLVECLNILVFKKKLQLGEAIETVDRFRKSGIDFVELKVAGIDQLCRLVKKYNISPYDAQFLVVANNCDCQLVTADRKFVEKCKLATSLVDFSEQ
ncbi:MAG: hypothetical protein UX80_C0012G0005 [Candidatus Amesbacteria bacterium GW2011_GWA2_47_11b]|uniref:PIN domain-containing protein n=3 Tax=Candidatus Amesiibacteriota TaxID=1752730 RepID=A0A0G1SJT4_9BACT|nr:MAG: hypothetical protein UX42_C0010G0005 [Microgenomates group bacterium GW2011_GWC1_46_20]KKU57598.1 MAG: hypothetical protein UX80_C0012G0005 [Candidatus Amesbacteria bacterium GW2011_GWA2_47_11b]KKU69666.1 MAG: hypothetical protein UX92_C0012G0009 [Candidatus Amesbacteria bacterium GW2011_GWA1_47_20]KKU83022.1 MAG: hypothetical protein UY11_C0032G0018 [Candidatus Amesbacteria bacterium GW2011_GWC2_47_8]